MLLTIIILMELHAAFAGHYKGGTITWRPDDEYAAGNPIQILIQQKHTWTYPRFNCNPTLIASQGVYFDANAPSTYPVVQCIGSCSATGGFASINHITYCTDYNINTQISTGAYYVKQNLFRTANLDIGYSSKVLLCSLQIFERRSSILSDDSATGIVV
jgi:hypothetical protein